MHACMHAHAYIYMPNAYIDICRQRSIHSCKHAYIKYAA